MTVYCAREDEHDEIVKLAKQSPYTSDFSNRVMFSNSAAYAKGWITVSRDEHGDEPGQLAGFACIRDKVRQPEVSLYFIGVAPAYRRRGVAQLLIKHVMAFAKSRRMALNCAKDNEGALAFYQQLGFARTGESLEGAGWRLEKVF